MIRRYALAAMLAVAPLMAMADGKTHHVAIHVDQNDPHTLNMALNNARNLASYYEEQGDEASEGDVSQHLSDLRLAEHRFFQREAEGVGSEEGHVDAALGRGTQEDQAWLRQQRPEVGVGAEPEEDQRRNDLPLDAIVIEAPDQPLA